MLQPFQFQQQQLSSLSDLSRYSSLSCSLHLSYTFKNKKKHSIPFARCLVNSKDLMTLKGGTGQACAACKHQRKRCTSECILAPYFPADKHEMFRNAHKLFGVSNIVKILKSVDNSQKAEAMTSIIFQSNIRDRYPVHGCLGMIHHLRYQIWQTEQELHAVLAQLEMYRQHHHQRHINSSMADDVPSQLELGMAPPGNALQLFGHNTQAFSTIPTMPVAQQQSYSNSNNYSPSCLDSKENAGSSMWAQHPCAINNNPNSMGIHQPHSVVPEPLDIQQEIVQDYNEIQPFFDTIDDRQSYVDSKEEYDCQRALAQLALSPFSHIPVSTSSHSCITRRKESDESSSEESLKDTTQWMEDIAENELKSAAACFTLTSVN